MPPTERDAAFLWEMLSFAKETHNPVAHLPLSEYLKDRVRQLAVERVIEILGEAARKVSEDFQQAHPEIPWRPIVAQRHVLAHQYGEIDQAKIWRVATVYVPDLISKLEPLIPPLPPQVSE